MIIFSLCFLLFINAMSIGLVFPIFAPLFTQSAAPLFAAGTSLKALGWLASSVMVGSLYPHVVIVLVCMLIVTFVAFVVAASIR